MDPTNRNVTAIGFRSAVRVPCDEVLSVEGTLPRWLCGSFSHTGPALFELPKSGYVHWFDGLAMLTSIELRGGEARYRCRYLESDAYGAARERGAPAVGEFETMPPRGRLRKLLAALSAPVITDNCNVNIAHLGDTAIAMTESHRHLEFDPRTLETLGERTYADDVAGVVSTAHPQIDRWRDVLYNVMVQFGRRSSYELYELPLGTKTRRTVASLPVERPAYMHSFAASDRYVVLTESPLTVHPLRMRFSTRPFIDRYQWRPDRGSRLRVVDKRSGEVVADVTAPPFFTFHHVNAVEVDGRVDVDLIAYPDPSTIYALRLDALRGARPPLAAGRLTRLAVPIGAIGARVEPKTLSDQLIELPRISPHRERRRYRYVYGATSHDPATFFDQLVKIDLGGDGAVARFARPGWFPNEPLFVPAPVATEEDEGVICCTMLDAGEQVSRLVVLDAQTLHVVAHAELPHVVPFHFHSQFFGDDVLARAKAGAAAQ